MAADAWESVALGDVAREITVGHVGPMASEYVPVGVPFLRSQNVERLRINVDDIKYISPEFHRQLGKSALRPGDVVIVRTGKPGTCAVVPSTLPDCNCSDLVIVRPGESVDARYLAYYMNSVAVHHVNAHLVGAVQQHFNVGSARSMRLHLPPIETQRAIAHILGTLDDKIDLNRRMAETLEAIARAIFKSWFVDFDPVRAKAEGRDTGLPKEIADLFPDRLVESEIGEVPEGWDVGTVGQFVSVSGGSTPRTSREDYWYPETHAWATPKDLAGAAYPVLLSTNRRISDAGLGAINSGLLPSGTVLLSSRAPIGYLSVSSVPTAINQGFIALQGGGIVSSEFLMPWCRCAMPEIMSRANGSTFLEISKSNFRDIPFVRPSEPLLRHYNDIVGPIYRRIASLAGIESTVVQLRDTLLPKLISGELRVPEAMLRVEEATA